MKTCLNTIFAKSSQFGGLLCALGLLSTGSLQAAAIPIAITGFNSTGVANLTTGDNGSLGSYDFYDQDFAIAQGFSPGGIAGAFPTGSKIGASGNAYDFADPDTGSDDLNPAGGTLTFAPDTSDFSTLYVLGTGPNGGGTFSYVLTFDDSSATVSGSVSFPDWNGTGDINGLGREQNGTYDSGAGNIFTLYDPSISIPVADQSLTLNKITLTDTAGFPYVFAISGTPAVLTPEPSTGAMMLGGLGLLVFAGLRRRASGKL